MATAPAVAIGFPVSSDWRLFAADRARFSMHGRGELNAEKEALKAALKVVRKKLPGWELSYYLRPLDKPWSPGTAEKIRKLIDGVRDDNEQRELFTLLFGRYLRGLTRAADACGIPKTQV